MTVRGSVGPSVVRGWVPGWARRLPRWLRRTLVGGAVALVVFTLVGFFAAPPLARHIARKQLTELLGRRVDIDRIRINPFALSLAVEGFRIFEADGATPFVTLRRLYVNVQASSLFRRAPVVKEIAVEAPRIHIERRKATEESWADMQAYNFSDILARLAARPKDPEPPPPPAPKDAPPPRFSLNNIHLSEGWVGFDDQPLGSHHEIAALDVGIPFVSTLPVDVDTFVRPGLAVRIDGTPFALQGRTKPFKNSLETVLELRTQPLDLTKYLPYVPVPLGFQLSSAKLTLALDITFAQSAEVPSLSVSGRVALGEVAARQKKPADAPLVDLALLEVMIGKSDLTGRHFRVGRVLVSGLDAHVARLADGSLNLDHLVGKPPPAGKGKAAKPAPAAPPPARAGAAEPPVHYSVGEVRVEKTALHFRDATVSPRFEADLKDVSVVVRDVSDRNNEKNKASFTFGLTAAPAGSVGATLEGKGTFIPQPLAVDGAVKLEGLEPGRLAPYYARQVSLEIARGRVRLGSEFRLADGGGHMAVRLHDAFLGVADLAIRRAGAKPELFTMKELAIRGVDVDLDQKKVAVGEVTTRDAEVKATRNREGIVDLATLADPPAAAATKGQAVVPAPAAPVGAGPPGGPGEKAKTAGEAPFIIEVARFDLDRWNLRFDDRGVTPAAVTTVRGLAVHVRNLSTGPGPQATVDLRLGLNKKGKIGVTGKVGLSPVAADLRLDVRTIEIVPLQPYFKDSVNLTVTDGTVSVKGQAQLAIPAARPGKPPPEPRVTFAGDVDVDDLATVDGVNAEQLLSWRSFHVGALRATSSPLAVTISEVSLADFAARLTVLPDGKLNVEALAGGGGKNKEPVASQPKTKEKRQETAAPAAEAPPPPITIGQVKLSGGKVSFGDRQVKPGYAVELTELGGRVSGLSSSADTQADVDISGAFDHAAKLSISGKANPLAKELFADVKVRLDDFELPPTSPYAGKYLGRVVSKGKLSLALDYSVQHKKLDAKNHLVLDQLTFGDKVKSPDAVDVPIGLAVAILKDRHGVIDLDVPIAGSLDDPQFKVWGAVLKVLGNLIVKAVTAPFSLIASAFGGGDELSTVEFAAGLDRLDGKAASKVKSLAKALQERPELSFEIEGAADPGRDRDGLRRYLLDRKLKTQKMGELVRQGQSVRSVDDVALSPAERPGLLAAAYQAETFQKPRNGLGMVKSLPPEAMEKLIGDHITVGNEELRALALRRANAVKEALGRAYPAGAARLFLVTPKLGSPGNRVEFKLKKE